jgi:hypothetical protein
MVASIKKKVGEEKAKGAVKNFSEEINKAILKGYYKLWQLIFYFFI